MINIVLIEDDNIMASAIKLQLKVLLEVEYKLELFKTISAAIDYLKTNSCDILISDLNVIDSKGIETIKKLDTLSDSINIIFISGSSQELEAKQIRKAPNIHFVMKDMDFNESMWHVLSKKMHLLSQ